MIVFWDWNGTLLDDFFTGPLILNRMLVKRGLRPVTDEEYYEVFDFPVIKYYRQVGFDLEAETFEQIAADYIEAYDALSDRIPARAGAVETLRRLHADGHRQFILSASERSLVERQVRRLGLADWLDGIYAHGDGYAYGKEALGRRAMEELSAAASDCLLVGDTVHDSEVADAMGIDCLLVTGGHHDRKRLSVAGRPVADSLDEICALIRARSLR